MSTKKSKLLKNLTKGSRAARNEKAEFLEGMLDRAYVSVTNELQDKLANAMKKRYDLENITVDYSGGTPAWAKDHFAITVEIAKLTREIEIAEANYEELFG